MPKHRLTYEEMAQRCARAEVRENNLLAAIKQAIKELDGDGDGEHQDEDAALGTLKAALKANKS
jgi:hypothetical protein